MQRGTKASVIKYRAIIWEGCEVLTNAVLVTLIPVEVFWALKRLVLYAAKVSCRALVAATPAALWSPPV